MSVPPSFFGALTNTPQAYGVDVVGVFDEGFNQLFPLARPIKANVVESAKAMEHPVESGATITDHVVVEPLEIELTLMLVGEERADVYGQVRALFNASTLLTVQTRSGSYPNMVIVAIPHDETPDLYDAFPLALKLREVRLVTTQFQALPPSAVAAPKDASTVKRGEQTGKTEGPAAGESADGGDTASSIAYRRIFGGG